MAETEITVNSVRRGLRVVFVTGQAVPRQEDFSLGNVFLSLSHSVEVVSFFPFFADLSETEVSRFLLVLDSDLKERLRGEDDISRQAANFLNTSWHLWYLKEGIVPFPEGNYSDGFWESLFLLYPHFTKRQIEKVLRYSFLYFRRQKKFLEATRFLYRNILNSVPESLFLLDSEETVLFANASACRFLGLSREKIQFERLSSLFSFETIKKENYLNSAVDEHDKGIKWIRSERKNGESVYLEVAEQKTRVERMVFTLVQMRDVSREKDYLQNLEKAVREAERAASAKSEFLANISHELRTPLNSILGMSELALELALNKDQEEYLRILKLSAESLYQLITSLLDYVKIESGTLNLKEKAFSLLETLESISVQFAVQCHAKGLGFHLISHFQHDTPYVGDETRIRQVIVNLLSNALKFTQKGEILLRCREIPFESETAKTGTGTVNDFDRVNLEVSVADTGKGIPREKQEEIFQAFVQLDSHEQSSNPGTGIGLSISRMLVEAMGGSIGVESESGRGAVFRFTIPILKGPPRKTFDKHLNFQKTKKVLLISKSWGWIDSISPWLVSLNIPHQVCRSSQEMDQELRKSDLEEVLCIFDGCFRDVSGTIAKLNNPLFSPLLHRTHIISFRLPREEETLWQTLPLSYKILYEPIRPTAFLNLIFDLEMELTKEKQAAARNKFSSNYNLRVFIAERKFSENTPLVRNLKEAGHKVRVFNDGDTLQAALLVKIPDILVLDGNLSTHSGFEIADRLRRGEFGMEGQSVPIAVMSEGDPLGEKTLRRFLGIDAFLSKPFYSQTLLVVIERIWERHLEGRIEHLRTKSQPERLLLLARIREACANTDWEKALLLTSALQEKLKIEKDEKRNQKIFKLTLLLRRQEKDAALSVIAELEHSEF